MQRGYIYANIPQIPGFYKYLYPEIRRLLEGVKRLDPEVWATHEAARKSREERGEIMADFWKRFWPELMSTRKKVNKFYEQMIQEIAGEDDSPTLAQEEVKEEEVMPVPEAAAVDPTEGEVWNMKYFFERDGEKIEAFAVYILAGFVANVAGEERDQHEISIR